MKLTRIAKNRACLALSIGLFLCSFGFGSQVINATHLWVGLLLYGATLGSFILWLYLVRSHQIYIRRLSKRLQSAGIITHNYDLLRLPVLKPRQVDQILALLQDGDDFDVVQCLFSAEIKL